MKRANNLFTKIYDTKNLELAFYKASKGKRHKKEVQYFANNLTNRLECLKQQIQQNSISNTYTYFKIKDPKERIISVAPFGNRVVHHAILNVCHTTFEGFQIYHSYATRIDKGTHKAIIQAVKNNQKATWFLKLDVKKFFDTINHEVLKKMLTKRFKEKQLLNIFCKIIDGYTLNEDNGLPIGNLTSQYFANFYLAFLDRYAKQVLKIKYYIRYMDDILVWAHTKKELWYFYKSLENFLKVNLKQTFRPPIFNKTSFSYNYLGYIIRFNSIQPNGRNRKKYIKKQECFLKAIKTGNITQKKASAKFWAMYNHQQFKINNYVIV